MSGAARHRVWVAALLVLASLFACASTAYAAPKIDEFDVPTADGQPTDIFQGPDGNLWYVEQVGAKVGRVIPGNPPKITDFDPPKFMGNPLNGLQDINVGPDGDIWITAGNNVAKIPPGNPTGGTAFGGLGLVDARGIAPGFDGNIWIVDAGNDDIKRITTAGVPVPTNVPLGTGCGGRNITRGPDGNMWVTCFSSGDIWRIKPDASSAKSFPATAGGTPLDIIAGQDGSLWFTGQTTHISKITTAGKVTPFTAKGEDPTGITRGPDGALWYPEFGSDSIGRVTIAGVTSSFPVTKGAGPRYIAPGPANTLWFTEQMSSKVGRVSGIDIPDKVAPKILSLKVKPGRFRRGSGLPRLLKTPVGTVISFGLSEAATARFTFAKKTSGRRVGGRCVKATKKNRKRARCTRLVSRGGFSRKAAAGKNRLRFEGRLSKRKRLSPGRYRVTLRATDAAHNRSKPRRASFTIARR
jgi:virginiamycin B lyase